jgi:glycosyltransferase involved in cell wall biosynthesis
MKIAFVHNHPTRFVQIDKALLEEKYQVEEWYQKGKWVNLFRLIPFIKRNEIVFCWFASSHAIFPVLLAKLFKKPVVLVTGGYDTANVPEANYGLQRKWLSRNIVNTLLKWADQLVVNSYYIKDEVTTNCKVSEEKITVVYHGIENDDQPTSFEAKDPNLVLTVGNIAHSTILRKGVKPFVQAASFLPEVRFVHAGKWRDETIEELKSIASENVEFKGFVDEEELNALYQKASVYAQPSYHEGFGLTVAEAMFYGCVPVVTENGSLPEVVNGFGVFTTNEPESIANGIEQCLKIESNERKAMSHYINETFTLKKREQGLVKVINSAKH